MSCKAQNEQKKLIDVCRCVVLQLLRKTDDQTEMKMVNAYQKGIVLGNRDEILKDESFRVCFAA